MSPIKSFEDVSTFWCSFVQSAQHMPARDDRRVRPLVERHVGARRRVAHEDARHFVWVEALVPQRGGARLEGDGREYLYLG